MQKPSLRVLIAHNHYQQAGGEDAVFANEVALLRDAGHTVETISFDNSSIRGFNASVAAAAGVIHNPVGYRVTAEAIARFLPDIVHVHNFFPRLSPAVFDAAHDAGVPTVWTMHNYRIACANGFLFRNGHPCEDCLGRTPLPAIWHRCYRNSALASAPAAAMIAWHRVAATWRSKVGRFIVLSDFARRIAIRGGVPPERIVVKPNFIADPGESPSATARSGAVFVGRLSVEKGVSVLLEAWRSLPDIPLTIVGDGPLREAAERDAPANVRFLGHQSPSRVAHAVAGARAAIVPSLWYENFPMAVVEAMAAGTPVIASRIGALETLISHGRDGLHFEVGAPRDLAQVVRRAFDNADCLSELGRGARATWATAMAPAANLERLIEIYREAQNK